MGVKIAVTDWQNRPKSNYLVHVHWHSGISSGRTNSQGIYDTGVSNGGTIEKVVVEGEEVLGSRRTIGNETFEVQTRK